MKEYEAPKGDAFSSPPLALTAALYVVMQHYRSIAVAFHVATTTLDPWAGAFLMHINAVKSNSS